MTRPVLSALPPGLSALSAHWGWLAFRGLAAIVFGVLAFAWPGLTLTTLVIVWGAYAVVDGAFARMYGACAAAATGTGPTRWSGWPACSPARSRSSARAQRPWRW